MKLVLNSKNNIHNLMRQCGYFLQKQEGDKLAFVKIIGGSRSGYPRFHIYLNVDQVSQQTHLDLHLDQKKPIYKGVSAHAGEYDGRIVEEEVTRIKSILGP